MVDEEIIIPVFRAKNPGDIQIGHYLREDIPKLVGVNPTDSDLLVIINESRAIKFTGTSSRGGFSSYTQYNDPLNISSFNDFDLGQVLIRRSKATHHNSVNAIVTGDFPYQSIKKTAASLGIKIKYRQNKI